MPFVRLAPLILLLVTEIAHAGSIWEAVDSSASIFDQTTTAKKKEEGFAGSVSLGYLASTGNTNTSSLNAQTLLGYKSGAWRHGLMLKAVRSRSEGETTAKEYQVAEQSDYSFTKNNYIFGAIDYDRDFFGAYTRRLSEAVGYGRRLLDSETMTLDLQIGAGARQARRADGTAEVGPILKAGASYVWNFSATANFSQQLTVEDGPDNTYSESVTSLKANLMSDLALSVSYTVKHNTSVPIDRTRTDTSTAVSLVYGF